MKRAHYLIGVLCFSLFFLSVSLTAQEAEKQSPPLITKKIEFKVTQEQKVKFPLKQKHANLSFKCMFCHEGQGQQVEELKAPRETACLECHGTKQELADRLAFIDVNHANPHNSIHDKTRLSCDECHNEHKPSTNMCAECHEKEIETNMWMRKTP